MNFDVVKKIIADPVINLLQNHVADSRGTVIYLQIIKNILDSFVDKTLTPLERVYKIWYAVFTLRIWRCWIKEQETYSLKENFISFNAYTSMCVEINAHNLIKLILKLKEENSEELFLPWIMTSQPCEKTFRAVRSLTSTFLLW